MALVPLITLWSCGGVVIRVRAVVTKGRQRRREREKEGDEENKGERKQPTKSSS